MTWRSKAACLGVPSEMFVADSKDYEHEAKLICRRCSVVKECLDYALTVKEQFGIWGGLNARERKRMLSARRVQIVFD